ncbi:nose resistant to fluoxetine protein 6-like [Culicoides brevitarsis]|uniref:nose resistant to fluoxetine protein 6-like n=1 Tax=Culicoides brevitarsis TaxID=469753 RepID=UPI00307C5BEE
MVHTYLQLFAVGENRHSRKIAERSFTYQIVGNATFSVDTFFFISGVLIVYLYYKSSYSSDGVKQVRTTKLPNAVNETVFAIIYRYIRLTPAYFFVIVTNELALKWTFDRSVFQPSIIDHITCNKYWYRNIFYVNNWYPFREMCMIWSWYMANDMQFYIVAIILLILSKRFFKVSAITVVVLLMSSWVVAIFVSIHFNYIHKVADPFESFDILYDKPWQRMGPYIVGMITGYIIVRKRRAPKISFLLNVILWFLSFGLLFVLIFGVWKGQLSVLATAFYVGMGHTAWGVGLVWICLSCYWGLARPINSFLSYRGFLPLSRLTYCAYLIHPVIMVVTSFQQQGPISMTHAMIMTTFLGNAVLSFMFALVISLLFEAPVIRILKIVFRK